MTRGKLMAFIENADGEREVYCSGEFNGDMYMDGGYGDEIIKDFTADNISNLEECKAYIQKFSKAYYENDEEAVFEQITEKSLEVCLTDYRCGECSKRESCEIWWDFSGSPNIYDVTSYPYHSDYLYVVNLTSDDVEMKASNGIVQIAGYGGAVFRFDKFVETEWDSGFIETEDSYDFQEDAHIAKMMNEYGLDEEEAKEWLNTMDYECSTNGSISVYDNVENLAMSFLENTGDVPESYWPYMDMEEFGRDMCRGDGYYELSSGRVIGYNC